MPSTNSDSSTSSFPVWIHFLLLFSCLIAVARSFHTKLNESGKSGHPGLISHLRGNAFNFSSLTVMLTVGFSYMACIMLRYVLFIPTLLTFFYYKGSLKFFKSFSY